MKIRKAIWVIYVVIALALSVNADVALDEVIQAGRFVLYRDHADPHKYYYVPEAPRLATKADGTPEFTFIKYTKTGSEVKGGIVHFLVTWGYTSGELNAAASELQMKDPEGRIAGPVPFKEGTFRIVSSTAGEGGLFNRRIVGEGKAPTLPGEKAAVSIALTQEGTSLLWESFKNPTSDISVLFVLKYQGVTPAFDAKLKVDWDKVYEHNDIKFGVQAQLKVVKLEADVRAILDELRMKGAIQLDVVGENANMQKMLDVVYNHLVSMMCEKISMTPEETPKAPTKKTPGKTTTPVKKVAAVSTLNEQEGKFRDWSTRVQAEMVESIDAQPRGGPHWNQEQKQAGVEGVCDAQSRQAAEVLAKRAAALRAAKKGEESVATYKKAYEACPDPKYLYEIADIQWLDMHAMRPARDSYYEFLEKAKDQPQYDSFSTQAAQRLETLKEAVLNYDMGAGYYEESNPLDAASCFEKAYQLAGDPECAYKAGLAFWKLAEATQMKGDYARALDMFEQAVERADLGRPNEESDQAWKADARNMIEELKNIIQASLKKDEEVGQPKVGEGAQPASQTKLSGGQSEAKSPKIKTEGAKASPSQDKSAKGISKPQKEAKTRPGEGQEGKPRSSEAKFEVKIGYTFKRIKLSGHYEVDMRKRLRENRELPMSGNISGIYQKYGEDSRFFNTVSLDDPTFEERIVEVILDGQDYDDFKKYVNSVSVMFRKQRFSGLPVSGEVKFFAEQFAQKGNRLSFKYARLGEATTEWLDYEYKPRWSFYGGVEWEGDWAKTSDSVLTLSPPVLRRTLEISVDEDNLVKNNIKALAIQIQHQIFENDITKEVVINYDKGDPLQVQYMYFHENGKSGYRYKVIWLMMDGREIHSEWRNKESPFIYVLFPN